MFKKKILLINLMSFTLTATEVEKKNTEKTTTEKAKEYFTILNLVFVTAIATAIGAILKNLKYLLIAALLSGLGLGGYKIYKNFKNKKEEEKKD